jgi:hypothetical protein
MKAFPTEISFPPGYRKANYDEGMDLRDYFAAKAMAVFLAKRDLLCRDDLIAQDAYALADAMMEARKNEP